MRILLRRAGHHLQERSLLRAGCLLCVLLTFVSAAFAQNPIDTDGEQRIFTLLNQERAKEGQLPLELNEGLTRAARKHSRLMAHDDSLVHQLPGEESLAVRVANENVRCDRDGENIALDGDAATAHAMLMLSPPHRANIVSPQFDAVGIAVVRMGELVYVTEDFAHVLPNYSEFEADAAAQQAITNFVRAEGLPVPQRKSRSRLTQLACNMALDDRLDSLKTKDIPGITSAVTWTATDLGKLPPNLKKLLAQPLTSGYALGVCYAPSVSHPGGVYWLVMVIY